MKVDCNELIVDFRGDVIMETKDTKQVPVKFGKYISPLVARGTLVQGQEGNFDTDEARRAFFLASRFDKRETIYLSEEDMELVLKSIKKMMVPWAYSWCVFLLDPTAIKDAEELNEFQENYRVAHEFVDSQKE